MGVREENLVYLWYVPVRWDMHLTLHKDGLVVIGYFALGALFLIGLLLIESGLPEGAAVWLLTRAIAEVPKEPRNGGYGGYRNIRRLHIAFYCLCGMIAAYVVFTLAAPQSRFSLSSEWLWPVGITTVISGVLIIYLGAGEWQGRLGWKHWAFWVATAATATPIFVLVHLYHPHRRGDFYLLLFVTFAVFFFIFGALLRVELCEARLRGDVPQVEAVPEHESKGQRKRRKRRERRGIIV